MPNLGILYYARANWIFGHGACPISEPGKTSIKLQSVPLIEPNWNGIELTEDYAATRTANLGSSRISSFSRLLSHLPLYAGCAFEWTRHPPAASQCTSLNRYLGFPSSFNAGPAGASRRRNTEAHRIRTVPSRTMAPGSGTALISPSVLKDAAAPPARNTSSMVRE